MSLSLRGENVNSYTSWWKIYLNRQCFSLSPCGESFDLFTRWWMLFIDNSSYNSMSSPIIERAGVWVQSNSNWLIIFQPMRCPDLDLGDGSLPFHLQTNGWLPSETIEKPLLPMVLETKNHRKTIDINGDFPSIHSMAMVSIKTFYSPLLSHPKPRQCTR